MDVENNKEAKESCRRQTKNMIYFERKMARGQQLKTMNFRFGELFSGPGGLALGAKSAKVVSDGQTFSISHAWATDYDKDTCTTYRNNICPDNPKSVVCCDIRKLSFKKLKNISEIDALAFGFPCYLCCHTERRLNPCLP